MGIGKRISDVEFGTMCRWPAILLMACSAQVPPEPVHAPLPGPLSAPSATADPAPTAPPVHAPLPAPRRVTPLPSHTIAAIDQVVSGCIERKEIPGAVVAVVRAGEEAFLQAYGTRHLQPPEAMRNDTVFDLASLTKPVTALAIMQLVDRERIDLDAAVGTYLSEFATGRYRRATVRHLLLHTAGLPAANSLRQYRDGKIVLAQVAALRPVHPVGRKRLYSDLSYILLGEIVERVSARPLDEYMRDAIFAPLGMTETGFVPDAQLSARAATTEKRAGEWLRGQVHDPRAHALGGVAGHAGLFSTARDVTRFVRMLLGGGELDGKRALSRHNTAALIELAFPAIQNGHGHTGFTGTSVWFDTRSNHAVVALSNRVHPDGKGSHTRLRRALRAIVRQLASVRVGIDVLQQQHFQLLQGKRVALITNHTGRTRAGRRTVDVLHEHVNLVKLFSPEHGLQGSADDVVADGRDQPTGLVVHSLYGANKRMSAAQLADVDTLVFDIQDIGARFYTYITTLGYAMEAAAKHGKAMVVLDRPNPIGGLVEGPVLDEGRESFIAYHRLPVRHGMTIGELAKLFNDQRKLGVELHVVPVEGWKRSLFEDTGLSWVDPSPNIRNPTAALLYPGLALVEATNISVGRGTDAPFQQIGTPWLDNEALVSALNGAGLDGVRASVTKFRPSASKFANETCHGVSFTVTDPNALRSVSLGLEVVVALRAQHPRQWRDQQTLLLLGNQRAFSLLHGGASRAEVVAGYQSQLDAFMETRKRYLLY